MQLTSLHFDNQTLRALPLEKLPDNPRLVEPVRQVKGACFSPIKPEPVRAPKLVAASTPCLGLLGLSAEQVYASLDLALDEVLATMPYTVNSLQQLH